VTRVSRRALNTPASATVAIADAVTTMRSRGASVIDMSAGRAAEHTPDYVCRAAADALLAGDTHQTMSRGTSAYRRACAIKLERDNGIVADPEREIIATMGVKQGLMLALMSTLDPGDEVVIEDPCFVSYRSLIRLAGGTPVPVPLEAVRGFRWSRQDLEARVTPKTRAILLNSPHNPTGTVHTREDLDAIAAVARAHNLTVITDEVYESVTWGGRKHQCIATLPDMCARTITVMGLTKTFSMGGWRVGFIVAPVPIIDAMETLQQHLLTCANSFVQAGAAYALAQPRDEILSLWSDWEHRCKFVTSELNVTPGIVCPMPEGGFYAWADITGTGMTSAELTDLLLNEQQVAVVPGSAFGSCGEGYIRLTCVRSWDDLHEAMRRIRAAIGLTVARL
jgi:aspartate aminotransferase